MARLRKSLLVFEKENRNMNKKITTVMVFNCLLFFILSSAELKVDDMAPFFSVRSGDEKYLTFDDLRGKVAIIFYESSDVVDKNKELKKELDKFYDAQNSDTKQKVIKVAVIDCSRAFWPFTVIWEKRLINYSKENHLTVYGDWEGKMKTIYGFCQGESNFLILDKSGRVKFFRTGIILKDQFENIKKLIMQLVVLD